MRKIITMLRNILIIAAIAFVGLFILHNIWFILGGAAVYAAYIFLVKK